MSISLGGRELSPHLTLQTTPLDPAISETFLLGGGVVIQADISGGGPTDLNGRIFSGQQLTLNSMRHLKHSDVLAIRAMAQAALPVLLRHPVGECLVIIIDTSELEQDMAGASFVNADQHPDFVRYSGNLVMRAL